jgi:hypothetical protein
MYSLGGGRGDSWRPKLINSLHFSLIAGNSAEKG